jgi:hypothetical protein
VLLGKYLAVTSIDSGFLLLDEPLKSVGWDSRNKIAYSPKIQSIEALPRDGYDEWCVSESPMDLGQVFEGNPFEAALKPGLVQVFVNFGGFPMHDPSMRDLVELFWTQLEWINPESYVADGNDYLTFVTRNKELFAAVCQALSTA